MDDLSSLLSQIPPEQLEQMLGLGTLDEEDALLAQQMEQAQALRKGSGKQFSTPVGALLGGLGDVINSGMGAQQANQLMGQRKDLLGKKTSGRKAYVDALRSSQTALPPELLRPPAPGAPQAPMPGVPSMLRRPEEQPDVWAGLPPFALGRL